MTATSTLHPAAVERSSSLIAALRQPRRCISGPSFDALWFWGAPLWALALCLGFAVAATALPAGWSPQAAGFAAGVSVLTSAHLIAVAPRVYLNRDIFSAHPLRFTAVPVFLFAALALSKPLLIAGLVLAVFWDVYHSAMQTFGLGRIYDAKAGADPHWGRKLDRSINLALYAGPVLAGASLSAHLASLGEFDAVGFELLAAAPARLEGQLGLFRVVVAAAALAVVAFYIAAYRRRAAEGHAVSTHKMVLLASTGLVSVVAWGFLPPLLAFATANIFHAAQYFAMVWLKEGERMSRRLAPAGARPATRRAFALFLLFCFSFGAVYLLVEDDRSWILAAFLTVSLMHFWYDSFVWSVRKKQV